MKKSRRILNWIFIILLLASLGFNILTYKENRNLSSQYESLLGMTKQLDESNVISFVCAINTNEYKDLEIFDISQGKVIKKMQSNEVIQNEVLRYIDNITGLYVDVKPFPSEGYIIRVPVPSDQIDNSILSEQNIQTVNEVYLLFPKGEEPFMLVLNKMNKPYFFNFEGDTETLLNELGID